MRSPSVRPRSHTRPGGGGAGSRATGWGGASGWELRARRRCLVCVVVGGTQAVVVLVSSGLSSVNCFSAAQWVLSSRAPPGCPPGWPAGRPAGSLTLDLVELRQVGAVDSFVAEHAVDGKVLGGPGQGRGGGGARGGGGGV